MEHEQDLPEEELLANKENQPAVPHEQLSEFDSDDVHHGLGLQSVDDAVAARLVLAQQLHADKKNVLATAAHIKNKKQKTR